MVIFNSIFILFKFFIWYTYTMYVVSNVLYYKLLFYMNLFLLNTSHLLLIYHMYVFIDN